MYSYLPINLEDGRKSTKMNFIANDRHATVTSLRKKRIKFRSLGFQLQLNLKFVSAC
jgi:hypothetical protein